MEQKRTLWIITATGFFLLVVLFAALILYKPSNTQKNSLQNKITWSEPTAQTVLPAGTNAPELTETNIPADAETQADFASNQIPQINTDNITIFSQGNTTVYGVAPATPEGTGDFNSSTTIDVYEENAVTDTTINSNVTAQNEKAQIAMKETKAVKNPEKTILTEPVKNSKNTGTTKAENTTKTVQAAPAKTVKPAPAKTTKAASPAATQKEPDRFWVQVGSYKSKKAADESRTTLDSKGLQCEVFTTTDAKGTLFYRVRVGPYTTKAEAEYWKNRVLQISGFEKSGCYITNTSASK